MPATPRIRLRLSVLLPAAAIAAALAVTVVLSVPPVSPVFALTVSVAVVFAPGARLTDVGFTVEALKFVLFVSDAERLKVVLVQAAVSLLVTVTVYALLPPSVVIV